jgi:hypothetical protein
VLFAFRASANFYVSRAGARTGLDDATTLRIVRTLVARGMLERADSQHYRSRVRMLTDSRYTIGYAAQCTEFAFSREVTTSITWAAERRGSTWFASTTATAVLPPFATPNRS